MPIEVIPPERKVLSKDWEHIQLWIEINHVLKEIPSHFRSVISISGGINATEIYAFGSVLGVTIEEEVVRTLNDLRDDWDPANKYEDYKFIRQAETFPDVLLLNPNTNDIILGIELKSWYLLAKESEPSFRFTATPRVCNIQDLLVVVPWVFSNVLSGNPIIFSPYIESARYVAEYKNYWWKHIRNTSESTEIRSPVDCRPYPDARDNISDSPREDRGKNFGRIARNGIMDEYVKISKDVDLLGIPLNNWIKFLKEGR